MADNQVKCPYCGKEHSTDEYYEYEEDDHIEVECVDCGKKFQYRYWRSVYFDVIQADCLNDGNHQWKKRVGFPEEYFVNKVQCDVCGEQREDADLWAKSPKMLEI